MTGVDMYDPKVMQKVVSSINDIEDPDDLENEEYEITPESLLNPTINEQEKVKPYRKKKFHTFLKDYLKKTYNKDKDKLSHRFCEKVYRELYMENVQKSHTVSPFTKVMYHPDVTVADYNFINDKVSKFKRNLIINQVGILHRTRFHVLQD